jgi:hypothetical protein
LTKTDGTTIDLLSQDNQLKQRRIEELEQENARLKWQRSSPSQQSPRNHTNAHAAAADIIDNTANVVAAIVDTGNVGTTIINTGATAADDDETAEQAPKKAHADNLMSMLDGVSESHNKVGGILVTNELERLWKLGVFI